MLSELVSCSISVCMYEDVARTAFWQLVEKQISYAMHGNVRICASWYFMSLTSHRMAAPPLRTPSQWPCLTRAFYLTIVRVNTLVMSESHLANCCYNSFYYHREWGVMGSWDHWRWKTHVCNVWSLGRREAAVWSSLASTLPMHMSLVRLKAQLNCMNANWILPAIINQRVVVAPVCGGVTREELPHSKQERRSFRSIKLIKLLKLQSTSPKIWFRFVYTPLAT